MSDNDLRTAKRKKPGTPVASPHGKAGLTDTPGSPGLLSSRLPKPVTLAGLFTSKVDSLKSAKLFLRDRGLIEESQVVDIPTICAALSILAGADDRNTGNLTDGMKSIYYMLKEMDSDTLTLESECKSDPIIKELAEQKATLARLENTIAKMAADRQGEMRDLRKGLEETRSSIGTFMHGATGPPPTEMAFPAPPTTVFPAAVKRSYAAALIRNSERQHASAITKGNDRERQIVLTVNSEMVSKEAARLSPKELVTKGDLALDLMAKGGIAVPKGAAFVYASTTRRGAIIYQINSKGAADWLKSGNNLESFASQMGSVDAAHARLFYVFVKFVPVSFAPDNQLCKGFIETNNGLPAGTIQHARYVKAPVRRKLNQRTAHVIMGFGTRELANQVIENGLIIENVKVYAEKLLTEPTRCFKCQSIKGDHRAADCSHTDPTCARCAGVHRTIECTHTGSPRCVNCQEDGHSAADRDCPAFEQNLAKYHRFTPDAHYRFYPIAENTHTWEPRYLDTAPAPRTWGRTPHSNTGTSVWAPSITKDESRMQEDELGDVEDGSRTPRPFDTPMSDISWDAQVGSVLARWARIPAETNTTSTFPPTS